MKTLSLKLLLLLFISFITLNCNSETNNSQFAAITVTFYNLDGVGVWKRKFQSELKDGGGGGVDYSYSINPPNNIYKIKVENNNASDVSKSVDVRTKFYNINDAFSGTLFFGTKSGTLNNRFINSKTIVIEFYCRNL